MLKHVAIGLLALTALLFAAALAYLLPAHLDVRKIRPALPQTESLRALTHSVDKPTAVYAILTSSQSSPGRPMGHHSVVVEWADGRLFLIDTGMDKASAEEFGRLLELLWSADPAIFHSTVFDALGDRTQQVAAIGFTHLHIDHTQAIKSVCSEQPAFVVVQTEYQQNVHNMHTEESAAIIASCPATKTMNADSLIEVPGFPGLAMYSLAGHTPGSTLFAVAVDDQIMLFSGDITNTKADLIEDRGKGFLYSYLMVPEDTTRTRELRAWLRELDSEPDMAVYVSHDRTDMQPLYRDGDRVTAHRPAGHPGEQRPQ